MVSVVSDQGLSVLARKLSARDAAVAASPMAAVAEQMPVRRHVISLRKKASEEQGES